MDFPGEKNPSSKFWVWEIKVWATIMVWFGESVSSPTQNFRKVMKITSEEKKSAVNKKRAMWLVTVNLLE